MRAKSSDERGTKAVAPCVSQMAHRKVRHSGFLSRPHCIVMPGTDGGFADSICIYMAKNRHTTPTTPQPKETTMSATAGQTKPGIHIMAITRPDNARWLSLFILCAGFLMIVVDSTIVNVALPSIQRDLGFSQSSLAWVVNAYLIAYAGIMLLAGRLGDLIGRKRIFLIGLILFTAASVLCGLSFSQPLLIAARFVQ